MPNFTPFSIFFKLFLSKLLLNIHGRVFVPVGLEMTRKEILQFIAMSGMTRRLVRCLSWMSRPDWHRRMISRRHRYDPKPELSIFQDRYVRSLIYDTQTSILAVGWDSGNLRIIFPDGTLITQRMPRSVTNITILTPNLIVVCCYEIYSFLLQKDGKIFKQVGIFLHEDLSQKHSVDVCCYHPKTGTIATGDTSGIIKLWHLDIVSDHPIFHCDLNGHTQKITQLLFHLELNILVSIGNDGKAIFWILNEDGTGILFSTVIQMKIRATSVAFVPGTNMIVFGFRDRKIEFWKYQINSDNHHVVAACLLEKFFDDENIVWIKSISFHSRFPVILVGTGALDDNKTVPAYLLYWGTDSSGVLFVNVLQTLRRFPRYSTLIWARNQLVVGN